LKFCLGEFDEFCKNKIIVRHRIVRNIQQQNVVAECLNKIFLGPVCFYVSKILYKKFLFFYLLQINIFFGVFRSF
jgi:hypothetical protein